MKESARRDFLSQIWRQKAKQRGFVGWYIPAITREKIPNLGAQLRTYQAVPTSGGTSFNLLPEATFYVSTFFSKNYGKLNIPWSIFYEVRCYRHEREQKYRSREFEQFGVEIMRKKRCDEMDAVRCLDLLFSFLTECGIKATVEMNCLTSFLESFRKKFGEQETERIQAIFDKKSLDPEAEEFIASLEPPERIRRIAKSFPEIRFNPRIVRGLHYYLGLVFEVKSNSSDMPSIGGGGEYAFENDTFGIGFALGVERLEPLVNPPEEEKPLYVFSNRSLPSKNFLEKLAKKTAYILSESGKNWMRGKYIRMESEEENLDEILP